MARQFGIISSPVTGLSTGIMINSLDIQQNLQTAQARNEKGELVDLCGYSVGRTASISGYLDGQYSDLAAVGSTVTIGGKTYLIQSVSKTENNTDFVQVSISARQGDSASVYMASSSSGTSSSLIGD